jgi:hypothetical protein
MGAQIELILTQRIPIPLRKITLDLLQGLIQENKRNTRFTRYLCKFILLHNYSKIINHETSYAKKCGLPVCNVLSLLSSSNFMLTG